jgi:hypothetical protein
MVKRLTFIEVMGYMLNRVLRTALNVAFTDSNDPASIPHNLRQNVTTRSLSNPISYLVTTNSHKPISLHYLAHYMKMCNNLSNILSQSKLS